MHFSAFSCTFDGHTCTLTPPPYLAAGSPKLTAPVTRADSPTMMVEAEAAVSAVSSIGLTVAAAAGDFGGYTIPIIGLGVLAATISLLAGPVDE